MEGDCSARELNSILKSSPKNRYSGGEIAGGVRGLDNPAFQGALVQRDGRKGQIPPLWDDRLAGPLPDGPRWFSRDATARGTPLAAGEPSAWPHSLRAVRSDPTMPAPRSGRLGAPSNQGSGERSRPARLMAELGFELSIGAPDQDRRTRPQPGIPFDVMLGCRLEFLD
jgi:hypothetical protein